MFSQHDYFVESYKQYLFSEGIKHQTSNIVEQQTVQYNIK